MHIRVVNPNTTASMTATIGACATAVAGPGVTVSAVNPASGPESIESHYDDALATPGVLTEIARGEAEGCDGYVIACFGDPGLLAAREVARGPVVGIAEAAMRTAGYLGRSFSVVTTLARTIGGTWDIAARYGVAPACAGMHACDVPVVDVEAAYPQVLASCRAALATDRSDVLVLGCAGMAPLAAPLSAELDVPVVDGVVAATLQAEMLVRQGLRTAKQGEFAPPPVKVFA